jgi:hypothetical protein
MRHTASEAGNAVALSPRRRLRRRRRRLTSTDPEKRLDYRTNRSPRPIDVGKPRDGFDEASSRRVYLD